MNALKHLSAIRERIQHLWENSVQPNRYYLFVAYRPDKIDLLLMERRMLCWYCRNYKTVRATSDSDPFALAGHVDNILQDKHGLSKENLEIHIGLTEPFIRVQRLKLPGYLSDEELPEVIEQTLQRRQSRSQGMDHLHYQSIEESSNEKQRTILVSSLSSQTVQSTVDRLGRHAESLATIGPLNYEIAGVTPALTSIKIQREDGEDRKVPPELLSLYDSPLAHKSAQYRNVIRHGRGTFHFHRLVFLLSVLLLGTSIAWGAAYFGVTKYQNTLTAAGDTEQQQFQEYQRIVSRVNSVQDTLEQLNRLYNYRSAHAWLLYQLESLYPKSMIMENLRLESTGSDSVLIQAKGRISNDDALYDFLEMAGHQPFITEVILEQVRRNNPRFSRFTLQLRCVE